MKRVIAVSVMVLLAYAQAPQYALEGKVVYSASYALGRWQGTNTSLSGSATWNPSSGEMDGKLCVDLSRFDSGNPLRDADGRGVFEISKYPQSCLTPSKLTLQGGNAVLSGTLDLHGVKREVKASGTLVRDGQGYVFKGAFPTKFSEWNLTRPTLIFVTVDDPVEVQVEVRATPR
ncbi:MAG: YceI family protein [Meiothermus sp.]